MTNGITSVSAGSDFTSTSLGPAARQTANAQIPDTVQLSDAAKQYLATPKTEASAKHDMVEDLVRAAAAGDKEALSLLTIA